MEKITMERRQWLDGCAFVREEDLTFANCSPQGCARPATLLSFCADAAIYDYTVQGLPYEFLRRQYHGVMLLSRIALHIHRCPQAGDCVAVHTWEDGIRAAHFRRAFELRCQDELLVSARSEWIFVNPDTRKIQRPSTFKAKEITLCPKSIDCPECRKITLPPNGVEELGIRTIRWSDLDGNGHLYSANYGDILWDFLPPDLQNTVPTELYVDYSREATLGQDLLLRGFRDDHTYRMEAMGPNGVCFSALCVFPGEDPQ